MYAASSSGYVTVGESGTVDVLSGSSAAKERARSYAAIVSSEAVAQRIKQKNADLSNLSTGQIRASLSASAGENAALITVSAKASSPKNAQLLANSALQATADYIHEIEQNPGNAQALVNGDNNAAAATPANGNSVRVIPLNNASVNPAASIPELPAEHSHGCWRGPGTGIRSYLPAPRTGSAYPNPR